MIAFRKNRDDELFCVIGIDANGPSNATRQAPFGIVPQRFAKSAGQ
jgi:hypothetical protein